MTNQSGAGAVVQRKTTCGRFLRQWLDIVRDRPDPWIIHDLASGVCYRNRAATERLHQPPFSVWPNPNLRPEDLAKLEDAEERALMTMRTVRLRAHFQDYPSPGRSMDVGVIIKADVCQGCELRCTLVAHKITHWKFYP